MKQAITYYEETPPAAKELAEKTLASATGKEFGADEYNDKNGWQPLNGRTFRVKGSAWTQRVDNWIDVFYDIEVIGLPDTDLVLCGQSIEVDQEGYIISHYTSLVPKIPA